MTKVSVIIPTYNRSWGLKRAIKSVLAQTFNDFELIIVDDCSKDDTSSVVASFDDSRIKYFRQLQNVGIAKNWNRGFELAQGDYVSFLMDDDLYEEKFIENRVKYLDGRKELILVFSSSKIQDIHENIQTTKIPYEKDVLKLTSETFLEAALSVNIFIGNTMYRRKEIAPFWNKATQDSLILDYSLGIYIATSRIGSALYIDTQDFIGTSHSNQVGKTQRNEVFLAREKLLTRLIGEVSHEYELMIRRELSNSKVTYAYYLEEQFFIAFLEKLKLLRSALFIDITNLRAWKDLLKLILLGKLNLRGSNLFGSD